MKRALIAVLLLVPAMGAQGGYVNPPPTPPFIPDHARARTLWWDFDGPIWQLPVTIWGPQWDTGIFECDEFVTTNVEWFAQPVYWPGHTNVIGTENRSPETWTVTIRFHVNNFDCNNPDKYIWDEAVYNVGGGATLNFSVRTATGYNLGWEQILNPVSLPEGGRMDNYYAVIHPNPYWEEFVWTFVVPPGGYAYLDRFYLTTICIPEPATGLGIAAFALLLRRR
jgi:hypothetical protein